MLHANPVAKNWWKEYKPTVAKPLQGDTMLKNVFGILWLGLIASSIVGCSSSKQEQKPLDTNSISAASIMANKTSTPTDKAEQLAKAAEQLLTVQGFVYANDVADLALQQDPTNLRAKFVKAVLAPIMAQRGVLARIAPLAEKDYQLKADYDKMIADLETNSPNSTLKSFLLDGQPDITTEAGVQSYIDGLANGFGELRQFAKTNKNETLTVMASDAFFNIMQKRFEDACIVVETNPWEYEYQCPSPVNMLEVSFSRADFEGVQQIASGYELYFSLNNSYDLSGAIQVALDNKGEQKPNAQKIVDDLLKDKSFGIIRTGNGFKKIKDMGFDAVTGMRWVIKNQTSSLLLLHTNKLYISIHIWFFNCS